MQINSRFQRNNRKNRPSGLDYALAYSQMPTPEYKRNLAERTRQYNLAAEWVQNNEAQRDREREIELERVRAINREKREREERERREREKREREERWLEEGGPLTLSGRILSRER